MATFPVAAALRAALARRRALAQQLAVEGTDSYRLLHGIAEDAPGVTIDRYGDLALVQLFRAPWSAAELGEVEAALREELGAACHVVCNHRGEVAVTPGPLVNDAALAETTCRERGLRFAIRARHRGQDPWLFLDLRSGRRALAALASGRSVLNLFAYTCAAGVVAACAGASEVWNVDFSQAHLDVGERNARANGVVGERFRTVCGDALAVLRQLARQPVQRRGRRARFPRVEPRAFGLVFLDPPAWAKGPFGAVDVVRDYPSLFKPALLATEPGGVVIATNHVPHVDAAAFAETLQRCAAKAGRPLRSLEIIGPDADFPSPDQKPPLKVAVCEV